jgi:hypothetical protein
MNQKGRDCSIFLGVTRLGIGDITKAYPTGTKIHVEIDCVYLTLLL